MGDAVRKQYDHAAYAERAKVSEAKRREEGEARAAALAAGKKFHVRQRAKTPDDLLESRKERLDVQEMIGRVTLINASAPTGRRGKGAGFWCSTCDLTYKDNVQLLDHLNSKQHLIASGSTDHVLIADRKMVNERLRYLLRKRKEANVDEVVNLDERLELSRENEEREREEKRQKRNAKRRKTPGGVGVPEIKMENDGIIN